MEFVRGTTLGEILRLKMEAEPAAPRSLAPHLPDWVDEIALKALAREPGDRFQSVAALGSALVEHLPAPGQRPASRTPTPAAGSEPQSVEPTHVLPVTQQTLVLSPAETRAAAPLPPRAATSSPAGLRAAATEMADLEDYVEHFRGAVAERGRGPLARLRRGGRPPGGMAAAAGPIKRRACEMGESGRRVDAMLQQVEASPAVREKWSGIRARLRPLAGLCGSY